MKTTLWIVAVIASIALASACRRTVPIIDRSPRPAQADGTISGTVRGPEGTSAIEGRTVEVINVETGERRRTLTNNAGGFTFKVPPGRYRVELAILPGESIVKQPGIMRIDRSDVDAHADFIIGSGRTLRPRAQPLPVLHTGLGAPIA